MGSFKHAQKPRGNLAKIHHILVDDKERLVVTGRTSD